jgi:uncharacterized membrane protein YedE/YeeE
VRGLVVFAGGVLFAVGLGVSGMTLPSKVIGFLDVTGAWDPSLALVMGSALSVGFLANRIAARRATPLLAGGYDVPTERRIDGALVGGAALFGVGWGLGGFCPGPALVSLASGQAAPWLFVGAMVAGMVLYRGVDAYRASAVRVVVPDA